MSSQKLVRPLKAAAMIILDSNGKVLIGQRANTHKFGPNFWAFPGGKVATSDKADSLKYNQLGFRLTPYLKTCLNAAFRELEEETSLVMADTLTAAEDCTNPLKPIHYLGRAITNTSSPIRYDAVFFAMPAELLGGALRASSEFQNLGWIDSLEALTTLPMMDVSEYFLKQAISTLLGEHEHVLPRSTKPGSETLYPLYSYYKQNPVISLKPVPGLNDSF